MNELLNIKNQIIEDTKYKLWMEEIAKVEKEFAISSKFNNR